MTPDPSAFGAASWGVLGALVFVILVLMRIIYIIFVKGASDQRERDKMLMDFAQGLTTRNESALSVIGDKIVAGDRMVAQALDSQGRMLYEVILIVEALQRARAQKAAAGGGALTTDEIDRIMRAARDTRRSGG